MQRLQRINHRQVLVLAEELRNALAGTGPLFLTLSSSGGTVLAAGALDFTWREVPESIRQPPRSAGTSGRTYCANAGSVQGTLIASCAIVSWAWKEIPTPRPASPVKPLIASKRPNWPSCEKSASKPDGAAQGVMMNQAKIRRSSFKHSLFISDPSRRMHFLHRRISAAAPSSSRNFKPG